MALVLKFLMKKFRVVAPSPNDADLRVIAPSPNAADQGIQMEGVPDGATSANAASRIINVRGRSSDSSGGGGRP